MTDDRRADWAAAARALPRGALMIVRARSDAARADLAALLHDAMIARNLRLLVAGDAKLAMDIGAAGLHLPQARLAEAAHWRARHPDWIITGAAHSRAALLHAAALDAVLLSPIFPTQSHRNAIALTPVRAAMIAASSPVPVYALGGVTARNAARLGRSFDGIAAIGALLAGADV